MVQLPQMRSPKWEVISASILRESKQVERLSWAEVQALAESALEPDPGGYRHELLRLLNTAEALQKRSRRRRR